MKENPLDKAPDVSLFPRFTENSTVPVATVWLDLNRALEAPHNSPASLIESDGLQHLLAQIVYHERFDADVLGVFYAIATATPYLRAHIARFCIDAWAQYQLEDKE